MIENCIRIHGIHAVDDTSVPIISVPPSKSEMHRMMIGTALSGHDDRLNTFYPSKDLLATRNCLSQLMENGSIISREKIFDCGDSGSTLRFLLPLTALDAHNTLITGSSQLQNRPFRVFTDLLEKQGFRLTFHNTQNSIPVTFSGHLKPGCFSLPGNISSQFFSGLLFALPLLSEDSVIIPTNSLESFSYIKMTVQVLSRFGIQIRLDENGRCEIPGNQSYHLPPANPIEGDYSHAAFWLCLGAMLPSKYAHGFIVRSLPEESIQGDRKIIDILQNMGARIQRIENGWQVFPSELRGVTIDVSDCPDLLPPLAAAATAAKGVTTFIGAERLRYKESNRLAAMPQLINSLGGHVEERPDGLVVSGQMPLSGGVADSFNDHRIAMAATILSTQCPKDVILKQPDCVEKSYPDFWHQWRKIGGTADEFSLGK